MNFKHLAILLFMMIVAAGFIIGCAGQQAAIEEQPPQQIEEPPVPDTTGYAQRVADSLAQVQNEIKERERQQAAARLEEERKQALLKEERDIASCKSSISISTNPTSCLQRETFCKRTLKS